jgi:single-stranded-DNA-specific exonuclease
MAAGLSIDPQNIDDFRKGFLESIQKQIGDIPPVPPLQIDGFLSLENLNLELVADLDRLAPFGPGNPTLTFVARNVKIIKHRTIGKGLDHLCNLSGPIVI